MRSDSADSHVIETWGHGRPGVKYTVPETPLFARDGRYILGDLIVGVNGTAIKLDTDLTEALADRRLGETVELTIIRQGQTIKVPVTLGVLEE